MNNEITELADNRMTSFPMPLKSLGKLKEISIKLYGITGKVKNEIIKKIVIIMSSDNGVVDKVEDVVGRGGGITDETLKWQWMNLKNWIICRGLK